MSKYHKTSNKAAKSHSAMLSRFQTRFEMSPEYAKSSEMKSLENYLSLLEDDSRRWSVTDSLEEAKNGSEMLE